MDLPEARPPGSELNVPRMRRRRPGPSVHQLLDRLAQGIGTGQFIAAQTGVFIAWIGINVFVPAWRWDYFQPYPLILLTLIISAHAAPLILLNQNRQTDRERLRARRDRDEATQAEAATEYVIAELASLRGAVDKALSRDLTRQELGGLRRRIEVLAVAVGDGPKL